MKVLADESAAAYIVDRLRNDGHDVRFIAEFAAGTSDPEVLASAVAEGSVLLTADKDFGELVIRLGLPSRGVVLYRLAGLSESAQCDVVSDAFATYGPDFATAFTVLSPGSVRIRRAGSGV